VYHDRYHTCLPKKNRLDEKGHMRTGPYDYLKFVALKESIKKDGVINPFIIEYYDKHLPNAKGVQGFKSLAIRTGNNRAEAMRQLKQTHGPALFVVPREVLSDLPKDEHEVLPINRQLLGHIQRLWTAVGKDGELGQSDAWRDSELLMDIIRSTKT
jgi:hypothetical protein